jgi:hypothetical protein
MTITDSQNVEEAIVSIREDVRDYVNQTPLPGGVDDSSTSTFSSRNGDNEAKTIDNVETMEDEDEDEDDYNATSDDDWDPEKEVIGFLSGECRSPQDNEFHDKDYFSRLFIASKSRDKEKSWSSFHLVMVFIVISLFTLTLVAASALSIFMIYAFVQYHDEPCEKNLALWLLIGGVSTLTSVFLYVIDLMCCPMFSFGSRRPRRRAALRFVATFCFRSFTNLLYCFEFAWFVLGTVWVHSIPEAHECPTLIYEFTLYFIVINCYVGFMIFALLFVYGLLVIISTCMYGVSIAKTSDVPGISEAEEEKSEINTNNV